MTVSRLVYRFSQLTLPYEPALPRIKVDKRRIGRYAGSSSGFQKNGGEIGVLGSDQFDSVYSRMPEFH